MKNLKMLYIALVALVAGTFGACTTDPYEAGEQVSGPQVSFVSTNPLSIEFSGKAGEDNQKLVLSRVDKEGELSVYVMWETATGNESLFSIPEVVTFAAGEATANLEFVVNSSRFENDEVYTVNFFIADEALQTPYGYSEWKVNFALNPWELMKDSKGNNAKGKFRGGDLLTSLYTYDPTVEIDVNVYEHKTTPGVYKIESPWAETAILGLGFEDQEAAEKKGIKFTASEDFIIDCTNPDAVWFALQSTGIEYGYGLVYVLSKYWYQNSSGQDLGAQPGTLSEGIITFPAEQAFGYEPGYSNYLYDSNSSGLFRIILPGYEATDYSLAVAYDGMDVAADNTTVTAKLAFSYGDDVTGVKYMLVKGDVESDPSETLATLLAGEDENILSLPDFVKGSKTTNVKVALESGVHTVVAVPQDKNGELSVKNAFAKSFYFKGLGEAESHPCEVGVIATKFSVAYPDFADTYPDTEALAFCIYGTDIKEVKFFYAATKQIDDFLAQGATLEQLINANNFNDGEKYTVDLTMVNGETGWVSNAIGLSSDTEYTIAVLAQNIYGESAIATVKHTTDAIGYTGELVIGQYKMSCNVPTTDGGSQLIENVFNVEPTSEENAFFVSDLGREDGGTYKWYATYDSTAKTLTISGLMKGLENYGPILGGGLYGQYGNYLYGIFSYATAESESGKDPIVFGVDPTTKQVCSLKNDMIEVAAFSSSGSYAGPLAIFKGELTTISLYTESESEPEAETSSVKSAPSTIKVPFSSIRVSADVVKMNCRQSVSNIKGTAIFNRYVTPSLVERYTPEQKTGFRSARVNSGISFAR